METILSVPSMSNLKINPSKQPSQTQCKQKNHNKCLNANIYSEFFVKNSKHNILGYIRGRKCGKWHNQTIQLHFFAFVTTQHPQNKYKQKVCHMIEYKSI